MKQVFVFGALLGLAGLSSASSISAEEETETEQPITLSPVTGWVIDYADDSCALRRRFEADGQKFDLEFRRFGPDAKTFQTTLAGETALPRGNNVRYRFGNFGEWVEAHRTMQVQFDQGWQGIVFDTSIIAPDGAEGDERESNEIERAAVVNRFAIEDGADGLIVLETGPLNHALIAMEQCTDELITHWGLDLEAHRNLTERTSVWRPEDLPRKLFSVYPNRARHVGRSGIVRVRMIVSQEGRPTSCHIQSNLAGGDFDEAACKKLMESTRYNPALDAEGQPIKSFYQFAFWFVS